MERRHFNPIFYKTDKFEVLESGSFWYSETPNVPNTKFSETLYSPRMCNWAHFRVKATGKEFFHFNSHFDHIGTVAELRALLLIEKVAEIAERPPPSAPVTSARTSRPTSTTRSLPPGRWWTAMPVRPIRSTPTGPPHNGYKYISTPPTKASRIDHIFVTKGRTTV